jgi:ADP-ribose pyrophosphatase YjhB (NUDIX family)
VPSAPGILARGPWRTDQVSVRWRDDAFEPDPQRAAQADAEIAALADRGSPAHDGLAARLAGYRAQDGRLELELQPLRWALRLVPGDASGSLTVLCVVRAADGCWLAGRRAGWVASWAGRWALGAGGAVELGEDPVETLGRELEEEWGVVPRELSVEALALTPNRAAMLVGQTWLPAGAEVERDHEHDAHAWWPADPADWPEEADPALKRMAALLSVSATIGSARPTLPGEARGAG